MALPELSADHAAQPWKRQRFLLAPAWLLSTHAVDTLEALHLPTSEAIVLAGLEARAVLEGRVTSALLAMARYQPTVAGLVAALKTNALEPLTRASAMRGAGYGLLFIELTAQCNEQCVHCYAESSPLRREALAWNEISDVLTDAKALGFTTIQLTGGDPLVSEHCVPAAERARSLGFERIEIYTNGLLLHGAAYERLRSLGVDVALSFYSHDAATHDAITRTPGSQRRTLAAMERAVADGLRVRASVIVMDQNREHVDETYALLRSVGLSDASIGIDVQRSVGRGLMTLEPKAARIASRTTYATAGHRADVGAEAASVFEGRAAVSYDGNVYPCIFARNHNLGNVRMQRLADILGATTPLFVDAFDDAQLARKKSQLACWDCRARSVLLGAADKS
jgi:AdoMet-dependent heme synthase